MVAGEMPARWNPVGRAHAGESAMKQPGPTLNMSLGPCSAPGLEPCPNEATRQTPRGPLCDAHRKRLQPSRAGKTALSAEVQKRESPRDTLRQAALKYADAPDDNDRLFTLIDDRLAKAAVRYAEELRKDELQQEAFRRRRAIRKGQKKAREAGKRIGRPPELTLEQAYLAVQQHGSIRKAAAVLGVDRLTVRRALARKPAVSHHGAMHALAGPLEASRSTSQNQEESRVAEEPRKCEAEARPGAEVHEGRPPHQPEGSTPAPGRREGGLQGDAPSSAERHQRVPGSPGRAGEAEGGGDDSGPG